MNLKKMRRQQRALDRRVKTVADKAMGPTFSDNLEIMALNRKLRLGSLDMPTNVSMHNPRQTLSDEALLGDPNEVE